MVLHYVGIDNRCQNFKFPPQTSPGGGCPPQWGTFLPNQPILMKIWHELSLIMWKLIAIVRNSNLTPIPPQGEGVLPPQWETFVPNRLVLMKFGMSCPYSCGNGLLLSEIQIVFIQKFC